MFSFGVRQRYQRFLVALKSPVLKFGLGCDGARFTGGLRHRSLLPISKSTKVPPPFLEPLSRAMARMDLKHGDESGFTLCQEAFYCRKVAVELRRCSFEDWDDSCGKLGFRLCVAIVCGKGTPFNPLTKSAFRT